MSLSQLCNVTYAFAIEGKDEVEIEKFDRQLEGEYGYLVDATSGAPARAAAAPVQRSENVGSLMAAFGMRAG